MDEVLIRHVYARLEETWRIVARSNEIAQATRELVSQTWITIELSRSFVDLCRLRCGLDSDLSCN